MSTRLFHHAPVVTLTSHDLKELGYDDSGLTKEGFNLIVERMSKYYDQTFGEVLHSCVEGVLPHPTNG